MKQLAFQFAAPRLPTLDDFIVGRNAELVENLRRLARSRQGERFLYVWGEPGSGRTHLLKGAVHAARAAGRDAGYFAGGDELCAAKDAGLKDCIAVDDVERLDAEAQIALFNACNELRERDGALLASGCAPPSQLALRQDLVTRLAWGLVFRAHPLSDEDKADALRRRAADCGFSLSEDVCAYLLSRARRDIPSLLALVDALDRHSLETKRPVTVALAREMLQTANGTTAVRTNS